MLKDISVIVPFFNEEKYLYKSVQRLLDIKLFNQIILVDDGSVDNSPKIAKKLQQEFTTIELIVLKSQTGKGNAIKAGLKFVNSTYIIIHDADLEYFPSDIPLMFDLAKNNPSCLVLGSRTIKGKKRYNRYKLTYFANKILTNFFSLINFYKVTDIASCYWLLETEILKKLDIKEKGFCIEVEVLSKFLKTKSNIIETPIRYEGRLYSEGKKIKLRDGIAIFYKIIYYSKLNIFNFR